MTPQESKHSSNNLTWFLPLVKGRQEREGERETVSDEKKLRGTATKCFV